MGQRDSPGYYGLTAKEIKQDVAADMERMVKERPHSLPEKIALACRMLADQGHSLTLAGQITARADEADTYWTTSFADGFADATAANLLLVDANMAVRDGRGVPNPGVRFHAWIYRTRPEVRCIVHTHPPFAAALSMTGEPLRPAHMDVMMFYGDCAYLDKWPGVPLANEEGEIISSALGKRRAILLAHHGILTTGTTVEEAVYLAVMLERAAQIQVLARSMGTIKDPDHDLATEAHDFLLTDSMIVATFDYWARQTLRRHADVVV